MKPRFNTALANALCLYVALCMTPLLTLLLEVNENGFLLAAVCFAAAGVAGLFFSVKVLSKADVDRSELVHVQGPCRARAQARLATILAIVALLASAFQFLLAGGALFSPLAQMR